MSATKNKQHKNNQKKLNMYQQQTRATHMDNEQQQTTSNTNSENNFPVEPLNQNMVERAEKNRPIYENYLQWNLNGFWTRFEDLKLTIERWTPIVICLQETHLQPSKTVNLTGYNGYYKSVSSRKHGVAVFVRKEMFQEELLFGTSLNVIAVQVGTKKKQHLRPSTFHLAK